MIFIAHRINTVEELMNVPRTMGIEIDVRDFNNDLVLSHDPFQNGEKLTSFITHFNHRLLVVNVKSYGIEKQISKILYDNNIDDYFFLDSVMSSIFSFSEQCNKRFSGRVSEFESLETIEKQIKFISWVWVDCFTEFSLSRDVFQSVQRSQKLRICLTSPDLLGRPNDIKNHAKQIRVNGTFPDAICTKIDNVGLWKECLDRR